MIFLSTLAMISSIWYVGQKFKPDDRIEYSNLCIYVFGVMLGQGICFVQLSMLLVSLTMLYDDKRNVFTYHTVT